jgi:hypothetical protein
MSAARGPALRVVRRAAPAAAYALVFVLTSALGLVLHLRTSAGRRLVARDTSALVSSLLVAGLRIDRIDVLSPTRLRVSRATLLDRLGQPVLRAEELDVRFGLVTLLGGIVSEREVRVVLPEVHAKHVAVWLLRDPASGGLTFETAFDTRAPKSPGPPSKPVVVRLPRIEVESASVATDLPGIEHVAARVLHLAAALDVSSTGVVLGLKSNDTRITKLFARDATGRLEGELRFPGTTRAELVGHVGRVPLVARAGFRGATLDLSASTTGIEPEPMRELFPAWPLLAPLQASAEAHGELKAMQARVTGSVGGAKLTGSGSLALAPHVESELDVHVEDFELRVLDASAPETALDLDAKVRLGLGSEGLEVHATGTLPETKLGSLLVPPLRADVSYARQKVTGMARVLEPGLETDITFQVLPDGQLGFQAKATSLELRAFDRFGIDAEGRVAASARGSLAGGRLSVDVDTSMSAPRVGPVRADNVVAHAHVEGIVKEPGRLSLSLSANGKNLDAGGVRLSSFRTSAHGSLDEQDWLVEGTSSDGGSFEASAAVAPRAGPRVSDVRVTSRRGNAEATVTAGRVVVDRGGITIEDLALVAGKGGVHGSIAVRGGKRVIDLTITELDVGRLLASFGMAASGVAGRLDGRVQIEEQGALRTGHAHVELRGGALPPLEGIAANASADFADDGVTARAELSVREMVTATLEASGHLEHSVLDPRAFREMTGEATLAAANIDLERAGKAFLAAAGIELGGRALGKLKVTKLDPRASPTFAYELETHDLRIAKRDDETSGLRLDIDSAGELFTPKGSRIALELVDSQGPWVAMNLEHALDGDAFARLATKDLTRALLDAPVSARVTAYRRPLKMLGVTGTSALEGSMAAELGVTGTPRNPELEASFDVLGVPLGPKIPAPELDVLLKYSAAKERYSFEAHTKGEKRVIELASTGHFGWFSQGFGKDWSAAGEAKINDLALVRVGRLVNAPLEGRIGGDVWFDIDQKHFDAKGELEVKQLSIERHVLGSGSGRLRVADGQAEATLGLAQGATGLDVLGRAGIAWGEGGLSVEGKQPGMLRVTARDFDLALLGPLVRSTARRVTGHLNGRAEVDWGGSGKRAGATTLRANATVRDGTMSLVAGGGLLQSIDAQALADGSGPLRVTFTGAARSRQPNLTGTAALTFEGPRFKRLDAKLGLDGFPLLYDGILMGRATTGATAPKLEVVVASTEKGQLVDVSIPALEVTLPEQSDKALIALEDDPAIAIHDAALEPDDERLILRGDGTTTLKVRLGQQVVVKRSPLEVPVSAELTVLGDGRLDGTLTLRPGGVVPALGQTFRITRGVIAFKKVEAKEGIMAIEASTRAADGTVIELSITGTVQDPDFAFRSDPPRSMNEIVALLLGIQADTTASTNQNTKTSTSGQLGRTAMALAMNRLLEGSPLSGLQFGAGETSEGEAVSSISMRVASKVWVEGRTVKGTTTSTNPNERVSGVVDWRFAPSWSLRTQLGDISGVELRWSLRY